MQQYQDSFSLSRYHKDTKSSRLLTRVTIFLFALLIFGAPLPFGSVQLNSIAAIELISGICSLLWIIKLVFLCNPDELQRFRDLVETRQQMRKRGPFFYRHDQLAGIVNLLTFGLWPNRNSSQAAVEIIGSEHSQKILPYHSLFGYPVKNTGLEAPAMIFLLAILIQLVPLPQLLSAVLSPGANDFYRTAASAAGIKFGFHPLSVNPYFTVSRLFQYTAYFLIYLTATNLIRTRPDYRIILYSIIASAFFQSTYGLYELFSGKQEIFEYQKKFFLHCASGTFINRNHFCAYVGVSIPLLFGLLFSGSGMFRPVTGSLGMRISRMLENRGGKVIFLLLLIGFILAGALFSFSLTGMVALILGSILFLFLFQKMRKKTVLLLFSCLLALSLIGVYLGSGFLKQRLGGMELISERSRFVAWEDTARIFLRFPITGSGSGTFGEIFPAFRTFVTTATFSHTHNELLEYAAEDGIIVIFLLLACAQVLLARISSILKKENFTGMHLMQIASFCSVMVLLLHNIVDFSFEIPAVAVTGSIVLALVFANYHEKNQFPGR